MHELSQQKIPPIYDLPKSIEINIPMISNSQEKVCKRMVYSHYGCHVIHDDIAFDPNIIVDYDAVHHEKMELKHTIEMMNGKLPAEHGHGTEYKAPLDVRERWQKIDPLNIFNPGIGGLSMKKNYD